MRGALLALLVLVATSASAQTEIHRCVQEDGSTVFQQMPCPKPAASTADGDIAADGQSESETTTPADDYSEFVNPFDAPEFNSLPAIKAPEVPASQERAKCEKKSRDAIDAIDLEMRKGYTKKQGEQYLTELMVLTKQLRACKQL